MPNQGPAASRSPVSRTSPADAWLSLGPASRLLGVDPDTLRRWADDGSVEVFVTPGRHRRFARRTIERLAESRRGAARPLASLGASPDRLTRAYRRSYARRQPNAAPRPADQADLERYREDGRRLLDALLAHLDADQADAAARSRATASANAAVDDLAQRMSASGTSLIDAIGFFVAARAPFMDELAGLGRRRALDGARLATLYRDASTLLDRLLLRLIDGYREGQG